MTDKEFKVESSLFEALVESSPNGIIVTTEDRIIQYVNRHIEKIFGYTHDELIGAELELLLPPKYRHKHKEQVESYFEQPQTKTMGSRKYLPGITKSGEEVFLEVGLSSIEISRSQLAIASVNDVTDRVQLEQKLSESENRYLKLFEMASDAIIITELDTGDIIDTNRQASFLTGMSRDQLIGLNLLDLHRDSQQSLAYQLFRNLNNEPATYSGLEINRDGRNIPVQVSVSRTELDNRDLMIHIYRDISKQKESEDRLRQAVEDAREASRVKSEFLANMSHEIRTPMNAIIGIADLVERQGLNEEQLYYMSIFRNASQTLLNLLNDILDLSKIDSGKLSIESAPFRVDNLVRQLRKIFDFRSTGLDLDLEYRVDTGIPDYLKGDSVRISQVLVNLLGNSIKFTYHGRVSLLIHLLEYSERIVKIQFTVEDTGIGISPEKLQVIFDRFGQADASTTRKFGGSGLGLSISRELVKLMGGDDLYVESEEKRGSRFYFTLPFEVPTEEEVANFENAEKDTIPELHNLKILVVEDSDVNRMIMSEMLKNESHTVTFAENGLQAVALYREKNPDLVFMDIRMPEMDGYEATREIRKLERAEKKLPVAIIALTADAMEQDRRKAIEAGCTLHLSKPVNKKQLIDVINRYGMFNRNTQ